MNIRRELGTLGALAHEALHGPGKHLVEEVRDRHATRGRLGARGINLAIELDAGVAPLRIGGGHLRQEGPALSQQFLVVDGDQQIALFELIAFDTGQVADPARHLGGQGDFLVGDHGAANREGGGTLRLADHELTEPLLRRVSQGRSGHHQG